MFEKPYSKESYDNLAAKGEESSKLSKEARAYTDEPTPFVEEAVRLHNKDYSNIQDKLRKMRGQAEGEAGKTNERYDALPENAKKANEELYNFQRDELGMHKKAPADKE